MGVLIWSVECPVCASYAEIVQFEQGLAIQCIKEDCVANRKAECMSKLDEAFAAAERVHKSKRFASNEHHDFNYLTLECLGLYNHTGDKATWAASFDTALPEEWYEHVDSQRTSARAQSPEEAIFAAARRFQTLTGERIFQE